MYATTYIWSLNQYVGWYVLHYRTTYHEQARSRAEAEQGFVVRASSSPIQAVSSHFSNYCTATLLLRLESLSSSMVMSRESSHYVVTCHPPGAVLKTVKCHFLSKDSQVSVVASSRKVSLLVSLFVGVFLRHTFCGQTFSLLTLTFYDLDGKNLSSVGCRHCQIETIGSPTMARLGSRQGRRRRQCYRRRRRS
jgi:hypothetical protein